MSIIDNEIKEVMRLRDGLNLTFDDIGQRMGFSPRTARRRYQAGTLEQVSSALTTVELDNYPQVVEGDYRVETVGTRLPEHRDQLFIERFRPLQIIGDAAVTSDWHIPLHDTTLVNKFFETMQNKHPNVKKLIVNGDWWHMEAFSSFGQKQAEASFDIERYQGNLAAKVALEIFDDIYFTWGNHDWRLMKATDHSHSFEAGMRWMFAGLSDKEWERIHVSELDYSEYFPDWTRKFRICHPRNYSSVPLSVARGLHAKYGCGIITGHSHHFAWGFAPDGHNMLMDSGGFYDKFRTEYVQKTTKFPEWSQGFTVFEGGTPHFYSPLLGNV